MTANSAAAANLPTSAHDVDLDRLHVASRAALDCVTDLADEGRVDAQLDQITHHAQVLVDMRGETSPFAALRAHALIVRNELILLATERSLTIAIWLDDALGLRAVTGRPVVVDPAEDT